VPNPPCGLSLKVAALLVANQPLRLLQGLLLELFVVSPEHALHQLSPCEALPVFNLHQLCLTLRLLWSQVHYYFGILLHALAAEIEP
jgi:hypothetical protein